MYDIQARWNMQFDESEMDQTDRSIEQRSHKIARDALELLNNTNNNDPEGANTFEIIIDGRRMHVDLGNNVITEREIDDHPATSSAPQPPRENVQAALTKLSDTDKAALAADLIHSAALSANLISDDTGVTELTDTLNDYVNNNWF